MRIKVTATGGDHVIIQTDLRKAGRSYPEGTVLTVPKYVGDYCINYGFAELVKDEPPPKEEAEEETKEEAEEGTPTEAETATAESPENAMEERPPRRRRG